jgi:hypothetical protein
VWLFNSRAVNADGRQVHHRSLDLILRGESSADRKMILGSRPGGDFQGKMIGQAEN